MPGVEKQEYYGSDWLMFTAKAAGHGVNSNSDGKDGSNSSGRSLHSDAKTVRT